MKTPKAAAQAAAQESTASEPTYPHPADMSHEEAAKIAGLKVKEIFAVNEFADRYHVITVAGQRVEVKK